MKISEPQLKKDLQELKKCEERIQEHPLKNRSNFDALWASFMERKKLEDEYKQAKRDFANGKKLMQLEELGSRKRVLRRMAYATDEDTITEKVKIIIILFFQVLTFAS